MLVPYLVDYVYTISCVVKPIKTSPAFNRRSSNHSLPGSPVVSATSGEVDVKLYTEYVPTELDPYKLSGIELHKYLIFGTLVVLRDPLKIFLNNLI